MKKIFSLVLLSVMVLPIFASAKTEIIPVCGKENLEGIINCTVVLKSETSDDIINNATVILTEKGGADVTDVLNAENTDWLVVGKEEVSGVRTVVLTNSGPGETGEVDMFKFTYKKSSEENCGVEIKFNNASYNVTPDTKGDQQDTGITLPYIALGGMLLLAVTVYITTKNKAKMYKI